MATRRLIWAATLSILASAADAAIDFTPATADYTSEGFVHRTVTLKRDAGTATFTVPMGWTVRGTAESLRLTPPKREFAEATVQAKPQIGPPLFDEAAVTALEQTALTALPPDSQMVQVVRRQENPVTIGQSQSFEILISYMTLGRLFLRSFIFVNAGDVQLVFRFSAPTVDFEPLNQLFLRSIMSWQLFENKAAPPATVL